MDPRWARRILVRIAGPRADTIKQPFLKPARTISPVIGGYRTYPGVPTARGRPSKSSGNCSDLRCPGTESNCLHTDLQCAIVGEWLDDRKAKGRRSVDDDRRRWNRHLAPLLAHRRPDANIEIGFLDRMITDLGAKGSFARRWPPAALSTNALGPFDLPRGKEQMLGAPSAPKNHPQADIRKCASSYSATQLSHRG